MSDKKRTKPKFPRQSFRSNWDMPHRMVKDYSRSKAKREMEEIIEEDLYEEQDKPEQRENP